MVPSGNRQRGKMTDIQTAIRENFTAEHVAHLRSDARYLEASISIAESSADAAEWEVELWTERGNVPAANRHAWQAAYHRAAVDFMHQLTITTTETETVEDRVPHAISIHLDADLFDGVDDAHLYDVVASLRQLAIRTDDALSEAYPDALVSVTLDARTSGRSYQSITNSEGSEADIAVRDNVRGLCGTVWESWTWAVSSEGGAL
jgi:hypothetical protein